MAGTTSRNEEAIMSLHSPSLSMLSLIAMSRLASIASLTAWEVQHARELIGRVQKLTVAVVLMHRVSFPGYTT